MERSATPASLRSMTSATSVDTAPGLRERKKLRTQRDLRDAALALFVERGFDHVTTDDIAAAAEVSKTTFYRYFDSKEDVLLGNSAEKLEFMRAALAAQPTDESPMTALRTAILSVFERYEGDQAQQFAIGKLMRETPSLSARNLEHQAAWSGLLCDFLATRLGTRHDELRVRVLAANITATIRAAVDHWLEGKSTDDLPSVVAEAMQMLIDGLPDSAA